MDLGYSFPTKIFVLPMLAILVNSNHQQYDKITYKIIRSSLSISNSPFKNHHNKTELNNSLGSISIKHKEVYHNVVNVDTNTTEITFEVPSDCITPLFCLITKAWARQAWTNGACVTVAQDSFSMSGTGNIRLTTNYPQNYEIVITAFYL